ncbi:Formylglycine-generating sulfatase enzyme [Gimesia maris]|uniref:formylglycine-generating enzyme family protein n=1 Tax=Gimesia maris TaxID=122 RepID=UPI00118D3CFA|nr:SUMF1/EgtB/PvdO family nonheme iron enzyme [Gimesia maris]QDU17450.1 Formylglycine-generating sulfatase enzyme [Gimesia maris]
MRKIQSSDFGNSTLWHSWKWSTVLSILMVSSTALRAEEPGELFSYQPESLQGKLELKFRYCPTGTIRPGKPQKNAPGNKLNEPVDIRYFYIGQTEVTLAEFRMILGEVRLNAIYQKNQKLETSIPGFASMIKDGQQEPAFLVSLEDAVDFCLQLQQSYDEERSRDEQRTIESLLFRLPSHLEWQYAARAVPTAEEQVQKPHFFNWVQPKDLSNTNQEKCIELWKKLGKASPFPGDQYSFVMLSEVSDPGDLQNLKDIYLEAFSKAFQSEAKRGSLGMIDLKEGMPETGKGVPNAWNVYDTNEGVSEWTIWANTPASQSSIWQRISQKREHGEPLNGQNSIYLSGGGLSVNYFKPNSINRFTVWGGPTLSEVNDWEPQPFDYQKGPQGNNFDYVQDHSPGFRLAMEKVLADDWLVLIRRKFFNQQKISETAADQISSASILAKDLAEKDHAVFPTLEFYAALAESKPENRMEIMDRAIRVAKQGSATPASNPNSAKNRLAALLNKSKNNKNSENDSSPKSDELLYFQTLETVVKSK